MKRITINKTALQVSPVCLGTGKFGDQIPEERAFQILDVYRDYGGNFLDTAAVYGRWLPEGENVSEQIIGRWLSSRNAKNDMVVATKGGHYPLSDPTVSRITKQDIESDIHDSMKTLGLDAIDFYWLHRDDVSKPVEEIIDMMEEFRKAGLIHYYGASNFSRVRLEEAAAYARQKGLAGFAAVSNQWSPIVRNPNSGLGKDPTLVQFQDSDLELFENTGMSFIPYNSTAGGYFEKKYKGELNEKQQLRYQNVQNEKTYQKLLREAKITEKSIQSLLLKSMISDYGIQIIPITAVSKVEQLKDLWYNLTEEL